MKKKIILSNRELSGTEYRTFNIEISLDDDCKNGYEDFSITSDYRYKNSRTKKPDGCGCNHEEILKLRPDLKIFVDLHLSDFNGAPLYAVENGYYHLKNSKKETAMKYLRITEVEYDTLNASKNKEHFHYLLHKLGIVDRWKSEAEKGIKLLEEMTGETWVNSSIKSNFEKLSPEKINEIGKDIKSHENN